MKLATPYYRNNQSAPNLEDPMGTALHTRLVSAAALTALALTACSDPTATTDDDADEGAAAESATITVGSANFPESEIIAHLYAEVLQEAGFDVETSLNIGTREAYVPALEDGSIDLIPEYTGNLLFYLDTDSDSTSAEEINAELPDVLAERGLGMLTPAEGESKDAVVVTSETAEEWDLSSIADLAPYGDEASFGGPPEFQERSVGLPGLEENYGLVFSDFTPISDGGGPATVSALVDGDVTAANIFTTSPAIVENDLAVLEDPENNFPAQQVVPVLSEEVLETGGDELTEALDAVSQLLTTDELIALNDAVSGSENLEPQDAAQTWLAENDLISE